MMRGKTGTLFVRCTPEEAERIHKAAKAERRSLSGYILHAVMARIELEDKLAERRKGTDGKTTGM